MAETAVLPKYVVLQSCDNDGRAFYKWNLNGNAYLQFTNRCPADIWEVMPTSEKGVARLKLLGDSKALWKRGNGNWVMPNRDQNATNDANSLFMVMLVWEKGGCAVAFKCLGNNRFINMSTENAICPKLLNSKY